MLSSILSRASAVARIIGPARCLSSMSEELKAVEERLKTTNAFRIFNLEEKLRVDERKLKLEFHKLQKVFHPDKIRLHTLKQPDRESRLSTMINSAYQTLIDPYKRGKYLLGLKLKRTPDEVENDLDMLKMDQDFLDRMMELRERIVREDGHRLVGITHEIEYELTSIMITIDKAFEREDFGEVLKGLGKLKFLANCRESLRNKTGE